MASSHLTEVIQNAAIKMGTLAIYKPSPIQVGTGSSTVFTDSSLALTVDMLKRGVLICTYDAGALGAAPEGEFQSIVSNTATAITTTAFTVAFAAGDEAMVIRPKYPLVEWIRAVNTSLKSFGDIPLFDTSLTMVAGQTEYSLPAGVLEPMKVWKQTNKSTGDYEWEQIYSWDITLAAPGFARYIRIPSYQISAGYKIGIEYNGVHPAVRLWNDHIDVPLELISGKVAWYMINRGGITDKNKTQAEKILAELNDADRRLSYPSKLHKPTKFFTWSK